MEEIKKMRSRNLYDSFVHASVGIRDALKKEPNLRIHLFMSVLAISGAIYLKFNFLEWAIIVLTIALVFILELINTTMETVVDIVSPEIKEKARVAKDVSAAGVLLAAITSLFVAGLLYIPKIILLF